MDEKLILNHNKSMISIVQKIHELKESVSKEDFTNFLNDKEIEFILKFTKFLHKKRNN